MHNNRWKFGACITLCLLTTGCTVWENARQTMILEPEIYSWKKDRGRSKRLYYGWAMQAWSESIADCPSHFTPEYEFGFRDGFVDYVYAGGDGTPPPVPPRRFWNVSLRTDQGHAEAQQWFAGYRHGVRAAKAGGYRQRATLSVAQLCGCESEQAIPPFGHDVPYSQPTSPYEVESLPVEPGPQLIEPTAEDAASQPTKPANDVDANDRKPPTGQKQDDQEISPAVDELLDPFSSDFGMPADPAPKAQPIQQARVKLRLELGPGLESSPTSTDSDALEPTATKRARVDSTPAETGATRLNSERQPDRRHTSPRTIDLLDLLIAEEESEAPPSLQLASLETDAAPQQNQAPQGPLLQPPKTMILEVKEAPAKSQTQISSPEQPTSSALPQVDNKKPEPRVRSITPRFVR